MSNSVFDPFSFPSTKQDRADPSAVAVPSSQKLPASEFNNLLTLWQDLRATARTGLLKDIGTSALSRANEASWRMKNGLLQYSRNALDYRSISEPTFQALDAAAGDGVTDDTAAIQSILDKLTETGFGTKCGVVRFALNNDSNYAGRKYRITKPLRYQGNSGSALHLLGDLTSRGDSSTQLVWDGPAVVNVAAGGMVRTSNTVRVTIPSHTYLVGDHVINGHTEGDFYAGLKVVTAVGGAVGSEWIEYAETGTNGASAEVHAFGQAMIELCGWNSSLMENIQFHGMAKSLYNIWVRKSSASLFFRRCNSFASAANKYSACWAIGDPQDVFGTYQTSEGFWDMCEGGGLGVGAVIKVLSAGNTKNFHIEHSIFQYGRVAIDHPGEGIITTKGVISLAMSDVSVKLGASQATLIGFETEDAPFDDWAPSTSYTNVGHTFVRNGGKGYQLKTAGTSAGSGGPTGTGLAITDGTCVWEYVGADGTQLLRGGVNNGVTIMGSSWAGRAPSASDICLETSGALTIVGNFFLNGRTGSSVPWIRVAGCVATPNMNGVGGGSALASIYSVGNTFYNAIDVAPFIDAAGGNYLQGGLDPSAGYARLVPHAVRSRGDIGGVAGALNRLREFEGYPPTYATLILPQQTISGVVAQEIGQLAEGWNRVRISYTALQAAALTKVIAPFLPQPRTRICAVYLDVIAVLAGTAGTLTLRVGKTNGGDEFLKDCNGKVDAYYGGDTSELGTALTGTSFSQGGFIEDWDNATSIYLKLTSSSGNLSGLTSGTIDLLVKAERVPGKYG